jgi:transposase-like protein
LRWPDGLPVCPYCEAPEGDRKHYWLATQRRWKCYACRKQFSVKVDTIFEDSPISLDKWLIAFWMLCNCKNGISSYEISRDLKVTQKTAWFMLQRLRFALQTHSILKMGQQGGPVEADEAYVGGKPQNMHVGKRKRITDSGKRSGKVPIFGILDRDTRQVRAKVLPEIERGTLMAEILNGIKHGATVYTDSHAGYSGAAKHFIHETVNHMNEYVRGEVHTNGIENFWSLLKRGLSGTYVAVEPFHLSRYVDEQMFRYNNRATKDNPLTDADRFVLAVSQIAGKRLTWAELTGKVPPSA